MRKTIVTLLLATASTMAPHLRAQATSNLSARASTVPNDVVVSPEIKDRDEILAFWTPARMQEAWPAPGFQTAPPVPEEDRLLPGADQSGYALMPKPYADPAHTLSRLTGILFFEVVNDAKEEVRHCSASVIHSLSGNVILTAAHCIRLTGGAWYKNVMFVPAYDGSYDAPLGKWPVHLAFLPSEDAPEHVETDIAVARVYATPAPAGPDVSLEQTVGEGFWPRVSETGAFPLVKVIGYPGKWIIGDDPYANGEQRQCDSHTRQSETSRNLVLLNCSPQEGNSGGPLVLLDGNPFGYEVVGVFNFTAPVLGQSRLLPETFLPIFNAAQSATLP